MFIFLNVFNIKVFEMMAMETKLYAEQEIVKMRMRGHLRENSHANKWTDVSTQEIKLS